MLILSFKEIKNHLTFEKALYWTKEFFKIKKGEQIIEPERIILSYNNVYNYTGIALLDIEKQKIIGYKLLSFNQKFRRNLNFSAIRSVISLFDHNTHKCLGIMDGRYILYCRTVSSLAILLDFFKRNYKGNFIPEIPEIGIIGTGQMLYFTLGFLSILFPDSKYYVYSPRAYKGSKERIKWIEHLARLNGLKVYIVSKEKIIEKDIVIVETNEIEHCVINELRGNVKIIAGIGSIAKNYIGEISPEIYRKAKFVFFDDISKVLSEHGGLSKLKSQIKPYKLEDLENFSSVLSPSEYIVYRSVGLTGIDVYFAYKLLQTVGIGNDECELDKFKIIDYF